MLKLQFNLHHQDIYLVNRGEVVATDSKNYLVAHFNTMTDDWETPLTAIFTDDVHKQPYIVVVGTSPDLNENECFVPWEVLTDECNVYVSVYCGNLHTTVTAAFKVQKSGYLEGETPPPPTPTVYEQILEELENKQDIIHLDNAIDEVYNPNGHYVLYYFDTQETRHNIFDFEVFQELTEGKIYEILDSTLQGDPNIAPSLYVAANQSGSYSLIYMDLDDQEHVIFDFSNLPSGSSDYEDLANKPQIVVANSPTGWSQVLTFNGRFYFNPFYFTNGQDGIILNIKDNAITFNMLGDNDKIFYNYGNYSNPPSDLFTNWYTAPYENGIWRISNSALQGLPVAKAGTFINYYIDGLKLQLYIVDVDSSTIGHSQVFFRISYMGTLGTWQEITNQNVVSGVVNQNGTITFTNSDGTTFTTTGTSVIGADGFSPTATVTQTQSGATVTITDKNGTTTANISNGNDYVLTPQDKSDIADIVLSELPNADVMSF